MGRKSESPSIVCIITARGGSKSLCRKNVLPLVGKAVITRSIEAASFGLPVVNGGNRQGGRIRAKNVIDVECETDAILKDIRLATSAKLRHGLAGLINSYGDGHAAGRIVDVLSKIALENRLLSSDSTILQSQCL